MRLFLAASTILLACAAPLAAEPPAVASAPVTVGEQLTLRSAVLGEERHLAIYLPPSYAKGTKTYPVLYLIDGGVDQDFLHVSGTTSLNSIWGRSQEAIVVGIETIDRRKELVGPTHSAELLKQYPTAGHSADFRRYIADEVIPLVEARYRTNGNRGVIGESLAGLFIVETALEQPDLFQHYAAISPSLWWDDGRLAFGAGDVLAKQGKAPKLYMAVGSEGPEMQAGFDRVVAALTALAPPSETGWCAVVRPDLRHSTTYHALSPSALQFLFPVPSDEPPYEGFEPACSAAEKHARTLDGK
ncbi:MAG: alpha/beta hydrolase-fold protein [Candidatus Andeanibacterium colombiense]|uniref:Alpha/beta hydrolase-fold protein n=1 Tax=Candidatus Andeanibacterium colombiense TaxID=3121345 RepID=A0AAJ6BMV5_9SPHN|nr:MAG: alpha/beta hydrolase-fold protein [Sphingomonadaceae bacterium]